MTLVERLSLYNWEDIYAESYSLPPENSTEWSCYNENRQECMMPVQCSNGIVFDRAAQAATYYNIKSTRLVTKAIHNKTEINSVTFKIKKI